jgi:IS30 family transposase
VSNFGSEVPAGAPVEDQLKQILESLPGKPPRSRLAPYRELIEELRRLGHTYRDIAAILAEKCQLYVSPSTIHDFVRIHSREKTKRSNSAPDLRERSINSRSSNGVAASENQGMDAVLKRIAALKGRDRTSEPTTDNRAISVQPL